MRKFVVVAIFVVKVTARAFIIKYSKSDRGWGRSERWSWSHVLCVLVFDVPCCM